MTHVSLTLNNPLVNVEVKQVIESQGHVGHSKFLLCPLHGSVPVWPIPFTWHQYKPWVDVVSQTISRSKGQGHNLLWSDGHGWYYNKIKFPLNFATTEIFTEMHPRVPLCYRVMWFFQDWILQQGEDRQTVCHRWSQQLLVRGIKEEFG